MYALANAQHDSMAIKVTEKITNADTDYYNSTIAPKASANKATFSMNTNWDILR